MVEKATSYPLYLKTPYKKFFVETEFLDPKYKDIISVYNTKPDNRLDAKEISAIRDEVYLTTQKNNGKMEVEQAKSLAKGKNTCQHKMMNFLFDLDGAIIGHELTLTIGSSYPSVQNKENAKEYSSRLNSKNIFMANKIYKHYKKTNPLVDLCSKLGFEYKDYREVINKVTDVMYQVGQEKGLDLTDECNALKTAIEARDKQAAISSSKALCKKFDTLK